MPCRETKALLPETKALLTLPRLAYGGAAGAEQWNEAQKAKAKDKKRKRKEKKEQRKKMKDAKMSLLINEKGMSYEDGAALVTDLMPESADSDSDSL